MRKKLLVLISLIVTLTMVLSIVSVSSFAATKAADKAKKITLRWFGTDAGIVAPSGVNLSNNEFVNVIKDYAGVDIKWEIPPYLDYQTKLNLLLASGNYPDLIHTAYNENASKVAEKGAFLDLKKYYDKSALVKKWITPEGMEQARTLSGHYYGIPLSLKNNPSGAGDMVRYDLVEKYNKGVIPTTVDEWVNYARAVKKAIPTAVPFSSWAYQNYIFLYNLTVWRWFGVEPNDNMRVRNGKYVPDIYLPEFKEAMKLNKQMYDEGLITKTFATNKDYAQFSADIENNYTIVHTDGADQVGGWAQYYGKTKGWKMIFAPPLKKYPAVVKDLKYVSFGRLGGYVDAGHQVRISKSSKYPDLAWKVIEGLTQDKLFQAIFWGKEGKEYVVKDGKRYIVPLTYSNPKRTYGLMYSMIMGYRAGLEAQDALLLNDVGEDFGNQVIASRNALQKQATANGLALDVSPYIPQKTRDLMAIKGEEARSFVTSLVAKYIMGKITMADFDKGVAEYKQKYQFIADERTKALQANKAALLKKGMKEAGW